MMSRTRLVLTVLCGLLFTSAACAQPLAEHLPKDAVVYLGWSGSENLGPGYDGSHLKAMIELTEIDRMISEVLPQAFQKLAETVPDQDAQQAADFMSIVGLAMWKHPTAIYFGGMDFEGDKPMPQFALVCEAGEDAAKVHKYLANLIDQAGDPDIPLSVKNVGGRIVLTAGKLNGDQQGALGLVKTLVAVPRLTDNKSFQSALQRTVKDPVMVAYVDTRAALALVDTVVEHEANEDEIEQWGKAREVLGLEGVRSAIVGAGFDGQHWGTRCFVDAPAPRRGILALMDQKALDDELLAAIPQTSSSAGALSLDVAGLVDMFTEIAGQIDPDAETQIEEGLEQANRMLGFDLMNNLLKPLGRQWAYYIDGQTSSSGAFGGIVVNRLRDADGFKATLTKLEQVANMMMAQATADKEFTLKFKSSVEDGTELHYLAVPLISPTWAVRDGNLYLGLQPQFVAGAAHHVASEGESILSNRQYVQLRKQVGAQEIGGFSFLDVGQLAPHSYSLVTALSRMLVGLADMSGVEDTPTMVVPPMYKLRPQLTARASFSWADADGYYVRSIEAFPGSQVFSISASGILLSMMTSALPTAVLTGVNAIQAIEAVEALDQLEDVQDEPAEGDLLDDVPAPAEEKLKGVKTQRGQAS